MITEILILLTLVILVLAVLIALRPDEFCIVRKASMTSPPARVFAQVNDLHNWKAWSPWQKLDPNAKNTYEGPPAGIGAAFSWAGNNQVGEGRMTIIESRPDRMVKFRLDFAKPFVGTNTAEFTFEPEGDQTVVTWSMSGKNTFMSKAFSLLMNCDKIVGSQFEKGLADLKAISETTK